MSSFIHFTCAFQPCISTVHFNCQTPKQPFSLPTHSTNRRTTAKPPHHLFPLPPPLQPARQTNHGCQTGGGIFPSPQHLHLLRQRHVTRVARGQTMHHQPLFLVLVVDFCPQQRSTGRAGGRGQEEDRKRTGRGQEEETKRKQRGNKEERTQYM